MVQITIAGIGLALVIFGFVLAFVAVIILTFMSRPGVNRSRGGGVLLIGPIPIIFGTDRDSVKVLMILAIVLIVVVMLSVLLPSLLLRG